MKVEYVARHYDLNANVREFTENKLSKLDKYLREPIEARVTLETEKHRNKADLHLAHRFGTIKATEVTDDMYDAIGMAVAKAEKQARRSNKKFHARRRRADKPTAPAWPVDVLAGASLGGGSAPRVIRTTELAIEFMGLDEAANRLADSKNDFIVFRNLDNDQVNVLYRRRDGDYGLISPEL